MEAGPLSVVPLGMKENTHLQIKHCAFIKNVATVPRVLPAVGQRGVWDSRSSHGKHVQSARVLFKMTSQSVALFPSE